MKCGVGVSLTDYHEIALTNGKNLGFAKATKMCPVEFDSSCMYEKPS